MMALFKHGLYCLKPLWSVLVFDQIVGHSHSVSILNHSINKGNSSLTLLVVGSNRYPMILSFGYTLPLSASNTSY